ncbi:MAG TPA: hypothetical protein VJR23_01090 [Candidatus Acidoferrales bacterium]|nr:hypothetical protein [Candidatus Acidoferrales bacterium]
MAASAQSSLRRLLALLQLALRLPALMPPVFVLSAPQAARVRLAAWAVQSVLET